jgi:hypothetical protein
MDIAICNSGGVGCFGKRGNYNGKGSRAVIGSCCIGEKVRCKLTKNTQTKSGFQCRDMFHYAIYDAIAANQVKLIYVFG